ncbi:MAG: hypothetical protein JRJ85_20280 [Deltaproteobacteria bacterium]|nr:hypothetical protein [Deltaproteobacteria bacterium]
MGKEREFTREKLKAMGERTLDLLKNAIEAGEMEKAGKLALRMYNEFSAMHDLYRDWLTDLFSYLGRRFGDEVLSESLEHTVSGFTKRLENRYADKSAARKLEILAAGLRGHLQPLEIEEDDEKFTIRLTPCGSGGRQVRDGLYDPPTDFLKIENPQPMTFDRPNFPVYCAHCFFQNITPIEPEGKPIFHVKPGEKIGEDPCSFFVYK